MADTTFNPYLYDPSLVSGLGNNTSATSPGANGLNAGTNWWSSQSPQTQAALIGTGTTLLGGYLSQQNQNSQNTQAQTAAAQLAAQNNASDTQRLSMQLEQARILAQNQMGVQGQLAAPTRQDWRQKQAVLADVLPQLRNVQVQAPGDLGRYMPQISGGLQLPQGGLSQSALAFFSPSARLGAEQDLDKQLAQSTGGNYTAPNYSALGYGSAGNAATQNVTSYSQQIQQQIAQQQAQGLANALQTNSSTTPRTAAASSPFQGGAMPRA